MDINIHNVSKIVVKKIEKLPTGSYCRDIVICTDKERIEITVFSEDPKALEL